MPDTLEALEAEAMKLSPADRRRLLERLVASLSNSSTQMAPQAAQARS